MPLLVPTMTANNAPSPYVASASGAYYAPHLAFDNNSSTYWLPTTIGTTGWLQIDLGSSQELSRYSIQASAEFNRAPKDWTVKGSDDGTNWTVVDTHTAETGWTAGQVRTYTLSAPVTYRYYRLDITANNGGPYLAVAQWTLYSPIESPLDIPGLVAWYSAENEALADGASITTWHDLSGNGNDAVATGGTVTYQTTTGPAGGPALYFPYSGYFLLPSGIMAAATQGEAHVYTKSQSSGASLWAFQGAISDNWDEQHFTYGGTIYESFGKPLGGRVSFADSLNESQAWNRYSVHAADHDYAVRFNNVVRLTDTAHAVQFSPGLTVLGAGAKNNTIDFRYQGHISGFVLFDRKLTTTERADLDAYLAANPSGGLAPALPPPSGPAISWWDGSTLQTASLAGWWDGAAIQPASPLGWWDGAAIQPLQ